MKLKNFKDAQTLIFDLGNVIVDLDGNRVLESLSQYTSVSKDEIKKLIVGYSDLYAYETGKMTSEDFISSVRDLLNMEISNEEFEIIWNSMLVAVPIQKLDLLVACQRSYQTMVMSNTNEMHEIAFDRMVAEQAKGKSMSEFVNIAYYSHTMGLRKPDVRVFEYIVEQHNLEPSKVVFFDDKEENIIAAEQIGIQGVLLEDPQDLYSHFQ